MLTIILLGAIVVGAVGYHTGEKHFGELKNPFFLIASVHFIDVVIMLSFYLLEGNKIYNLLKGFHWSILLLVIAGIGFEVSLLLSYKFGGKISNMFIITASLITILLVFIGVVFLQEVITLLDALGIIISIIGVYFVNKKSNKENV